MFLNHGFMAGLRLNFVIINNLRIFDNLVERQKWHLQTNWVRWCILVTRYRNMHSCKFDLSMIRDSSWKFHFENNSDRYYKLQLFAHVSWILYNSYTITTKNRLYGASYGSYIFSYVLTQKALTQPDEHCDWTRSNAEQISVVIPLWHHQQ